MWNPLDEVVRSQKAGESHGITSVCSAHPLVIEASVRQALASGGTLLVEATSNQVDQYGGYTGMRPEDFRELVHGIATEHGLPLDRVVLGGDHLGPNRWRSLPPQEAMAEADILVAAYVRAGFTKIHLDCSFSCAGDPVPLTDDVVAERTARRCVWPRRPRALCRRPALRHRHRGAGAGRGPRDPGGHGGHQPSVAAA